MHNFCNAPALLSGGSFHWCLFLFENTWDTFALNVVSEGVTVTGISAHLNCIIILLLIFKFLLCIS
jgi:hypothetical protein